MEIIDFRFRPNTSETISGISNSSMFKGLCEAIACSKMKVQSLEEIVEDLDRYNITKAVITGRDCETTYSAKSNNKSVVEFVNKYPSKFIGYAGVDPHKSMRAIEELQHAVSQLGLKGAAIDPSLAQIYVNDAKYYPIYSKCCELKIPIVITTGPSTLVQNAVIDHVAPRYIDFVARDFPELKIIVSHGGYPWVNEMIMVAQRNQNVYVEISEYEFFPLGELYIQAANTIISDKVLFASAHPFVDFKDSLKSYEEMPFSPEVREKVMYKNAAKVLNLHELATPTAVNTVDSIQIQRIIENVIKELAHKGMLARR